MPKELGRSIRRLLHQPGVYKTVLGPYHNCRHRYAPGSLKFQMDIPRGIKVNGYFGDGVRDLFVYIDPIEQRESVKQYLREEYSF